MKRILLASLLAAVALPAWAQDDFGTDETAGAGSQPAQPAEPEPVPISEPEPQPEPVPDPVAEAPAASDGGDDFDSDRGNPADRFLGIGTGYVLPTDLDAVNTVSVRFRFGQITLEPFVDFSFSRNSMDVGAGSIDTDMFNIGAGANLRYAFTSSRGIELVGLGGATFNFDVVDPEGDENNTNTTTFSITWGVGLDYWATSRWVISMAAFNPLMSVQRTTQQTIGADMTDSTYGFGLIFNPTVVGMVHLFF